MAVPAQSVAMGSLPACSPPLPWDLAWTLLREGESPALSPGAPSPSQQTGRPNAEFPPRTCLFPYWDMKTG